MSDLVSVIIPAHNAERYLEPTLHSALGQTYGALEVIVVNDASRDTTARVASRVAATDRRVKLVSFKSNVGAAQARNAGIELAAGRYIAFLDSDDLWAPEKTVRQIERLRATGAALAYTGYRTIDEQGRCRSAPMRVPERVTHAELLHTNVIPCSSAMYDTARLGKVYMPELAKRQDYGLWLRILKSTRMGANAAAVGIDEPLLFYRVHSASLSANKLDAARYQWRVYRELEHMPLWHSAYCFAHYAVNGFLKHQRH